MRRTAIEVANSILSHYQRSGKCKCKCKWTPTIEHSLHRLGLRHYLNPSLVSRVIDPHLLHHPSLSLGFFDWSSQQPTFSHSSTSYSSLLKSLLFFLHSHPFHPVLKQPPAPKISLCSDIYHPVYRILKQARAEKIHLCSHIYRDIIYARVFVGKSIEAFSIYKIAGFENCDIGFNGFNLLLSGLASDSHLMCAREVFDEMNQRGVFFTTLGFGVFLWRFCGKVELSELLEVLEGGKRGNWGVNGSVLAVLVVHGLCMENKVKDAFLILDELRKRECKPDFMAYRVVAEAFRVNGYVVEVEVTLKKKRKFGVAPRANDYREFLFSLISENRFWEAKELGNVIVSGNFPIEDDVLNALIESVSDVYPSSGMMFFKFMIGRGTFPTLVTLGSFCTNLCKNEKIDDLLEVFQILSSKEYFSDVKRYSMMVSYLCKAGKVKEAYEVIETMKKKGLYPDVSMYNCIIEACCREGLVRPAKKLWDEMFKSGCSGDLNTYNILIKKFSETGQVKEAHGLFSHMLEKGVIPDFTTYKFLLQGLCKGNELKKSLEIFSKCSQQDPLLARSLLNTFIILLCEEGYFCGASELLCGVCASIGRSDSHVILLKWLVVVRDVSLATEHLKKIRNNSVKLLQQVCRELEAASVPSLSNTNPMFPFLPQTQ